MQIASGAFGFGWEENRKPVYSVEEFAARVDKSHWTVRSWCNRGRIRANRIQIGTIGLFRISDEELMRYLCDGLRPPDDQTPED